MNDLSIDTSTFLKEYASYFATMPDDHYLVIQKQFDFLRIVFPDDLEALSLAYDRYFEEEGCKTPFQNGADD